MFQPVEFYPKFDRSVGNEFRSNKIDNSFLKTTRKSALSSLFQLSKVFGLLPLDRELNYSTKRMLYSVVLSLAFLVVTLGYKTAYMIQTQDFADKPWNKIIFYCRALIENVIIVSHLPQMIIHRKELHDIFFEMANIGFGSSNARFFAPGGCLVIVANCILVSAMEMSDSTGVRATLATCLSEILCLIILIQFCSVLEVFKKEIDGLTKKISLHQAKLEILADRRQNILELASFTNQVYSVQLLLICFKLFNDVIYLAYFTIIDIKSVTSPKWNPAKVIRMPLYASWHLMELYLIASSTEQLIDSAENFNGELFQLMRDNKDLCKNRKLNLCLAMKQTVNFTACGFFTLGYPLVTSIIAAATTYLVILVQFSL